MAVMAAQIGLDQMVGDDVDFGFGAAAGGDQTAGEVAEGLVVDDHRFSPDRPNKKSTEGLLFVNKKKQKNFPTLLPLAYIQLRGRYANGNELLKFFWFFLFTKRTRFPKD